MKMAYVSPIAAPPPENNFLLGYLPSEIKKYLFQHLDVVSLQPGMALYEAGDHISHAYFPVNAIISLQYMMEDGSSSEIAVVGSEGMVGISLFLGRHKMMCRAIVQSAGYAYRMPVRTLKDVFNRYIQFNHLLLRYTMVQLVKISITAACNRHHTISQQLCRRLLMSLDRLKSNHVIITQDLIAHMLGVRREGITDAAGKLQEQGIIKYHRGDISILDRQKLEQQCCECYAIMKEEGARLLPHKSASSGNQQK